MSMLPTSAVLMRETIMKRPNGAPVVKSPESSDADDDNESVLSDESSSCDLNAHDKSRPTLLDDDEAATLHAVDEVEKTGNEEESATRPPPPPPERMASILLTASGMQESNLVAEEVVPSMAKSSNASKSPRQPRAKDSTGSRATKRHQLLVVDESQVIAQQPDILQHCAPAKRVIHESGEKKERVHNGIFKLSAFKWIESSLRQSMWHYGRFCANFGIFTTILHLLVLTLAVAGVIYYAQATTLNTSLLQLTPSVRTQHDRLTHDVFNSTNPRYDAFDRSNAHTYGVILSTKSTHDSIINEEAVGVYLALQAQIDAITVELRRSTAPNTSTRAAWNESTTSELCAGRCVHPFTLIVNSEIAIPLTYPQTFVVFDDAGADVRDIWLRNVLGGVRTSQDGVITHARSIVLRYDLADDADDDVEAEWARQFKKQVAMMASDPWVAANLDVDVWTYGTFEDSVEHSAVKSLTHLGYSALIVMILLVLLCMAWNDNYASRPILGLVIFVVVVSCVATAVGALIALGRELNAFIYVVVPPLIGVISLLALSLVHAWRRYSNVAVHSTEKTQLVLAWHMPSCVGVLVTLAIVFLVAGQITSVAHMTYACNTMAIGSAVAIVGLLTTFAAVLAITGRRQSRGKTWWHCCYGGDTAESSVPPRSDTPYSTPYLDALHRRLCDRSPTLSRRMGAAIASVHWRFISALLLVVYLIFAVWAALQTTVSLHESTLIERESDSKEFLDAHTRFYGDNDDYVELFFDDYVDYMDDGVRTNIAQMLQWAEDREYSYRMTSWLSAFQGFNKTTKYLVNEDTFVKVLDLIYLVDVNYDEYASDIAFDSFKTRIVATRMYIQLSQQGIVHVHELVAHLTSMAHAANLPLTIRSPLVLSIEHDLSVVPIALTLLAVVACLASVMTLVLHAEPFSSLLVMLVVASVDVGTVGVGAFWSMPLTMLSVSSIACMSAYTIASAMLVCHHYVHAGSCHAHHSGARVMYTFQACLPPLLGSAVIAVGAVLPLLAVHSPIILQFVKITLVHTCLTLLHTLIFLPVCLTLVVEHLPHMCVTMRACMEEACCACCDVEEEAESIYFVTTTGRPMVDENTLKHAIRHGYDGVRERRSMAPNYPLPMVPDNLYIAQATGGYDQYATVNKGPRAPDSASSYSPSTIDRHDDGAESDGESLYEDPSELVDTSKARRHARTTDESPSECSRPPVYTVTQPHSPRVHRGADLTRNWRQYMLDGSIRRNSMAPSHGSSAYGHPPPPVMMMPAYAMPRQRMSYAGGYRYEADCHDHAYRGPMPYFNEE